MQSVALWRGMKFLRGLPLDRVPAHGERALVRGDSSVRTLQGGASCLQKAMRHAHPKAMVEPQMYGQMLLEGHHSIGDEEHVEGSPKVGRPLCCIVRRCWAKRHTERQDCPSSGHRASTCASAASVCGSQKVGLESILWEPHMFSQKNVRNFLASRK